MSDEILIRAENISKKFCRSLKKSLWYGVKDIVGDINPFQGKAENRKLKAGNGELRKDEFWAVNDVSFELHRGECLGLIGRNGAGKTTLLKMLNGLIKPDHGRIEMRGRIGALIALGAGFNPILSGRENIYVNGSVLGLTKKEIDGKIEEIIDFADIRDFIDAPVQTYSSGMSVRLGFAIATALKPDVLILDEVLAVGDFRFRMKCLDRITDLLQETAVLFVSHNPEQVRRICNRGLYLKSGSVVALGPTSEVLTSYEQAADNNDSSESYASESISALSWRSPRTQRVAFGENLDVTLAVKANLPVENALIRLLFYSSDGQLAGEWMSNQYGLRYDLPNGMETAISLQIGPLKLRAGLYQISVIVACSENIKYHAHTKQIALVEIVGASNLLAFYQV